MKRCLTAVKISLQLTKIFLVGAALFARPVRTTPYFDLQRCVLRINPALCVRGGMQRG